MGISAHQSVLKNLLDSLNNFSLSEDSIKKVHRCLMGNPFAWEAEFEPELVGNYRNIPIGGFRQPFFEDKEYVAHYRLIDVMGTWVEMFNNRFSDIDNTTEEKHILTRIAYFHNKFLNELHPFADGNGRVCRIIIGAILMQNDCPPIFPEITTQEEQIEYITTIVNCESEKSDILLVTYFAEGMTDYLMKRVKEKSYTLSFTSFINHSKVLPFLPSSLVK
ncbi:Fic family protein [Subsaximicrobium wynnwilliamsii]|uniref:Fic family protein n=1 Tax=Subsaximicrobium wynnwilliamsii TaxID=291179 RepID=UPI001CB97C21|nr:Fic family protein [Subsaximicrobium wynnwilliamsii]